MIIWEAAINFDLDGKTALVCAGSRGIGAATAHALAELGCRVVILARSRPNLEATRAQLVGDGHVMMSVDLTDHIRVMDLVAEALDQLGPIQILINNMAGPAAGPLLKAQPEAFLEGVRQHVALGQRLVQELVGGMRESGYGRVVNVISTSVKVPIPGLGVSNTVRGAMANWAKTLAYELAPDGITVNNVLPGFTQTDRLESLITTRASKSEIEPDKVAAGMMDSVPMGRFGTAAEVAAAIAFLASPAASYITGVNIPVDGGRTGCL